MRARHIRRAPPGAADGPADLSEGEARSTTTRATPARITQPSAADLAMDSVSDHDPHSSRSTWPRLHTRDHGEDHGESRKTKVIAGTVAGVGMLLFAGVALIWYMVWKERQRRKRAREIARTRSDPLTVEQPVLITPFPFSEPATSRPSSPGGTLRTHFSDPGPTTYSAKPFTYLQHGGYGKLGYPSSPASTRPNAPKRASTELPRRQGKHAKRLSSSMNVPPNGRRRSELPPPLLPSVAGSPVSSHGESPNLTPVENVRLPPLPLPGSHQSFEQAARTSLHMEHALQQRQSLPQAATPPLVQLPQYSPMPPARPLPRSPHDSPRSPHQPLLTPPLLSSPQQAPWPLQPVAPSHVLGGHSPVVASRPISYPPSRASLTPPTSRGPSPLAPRGPSPYAAPPKRGPAPPRQLSLSAPLATPPSAYTKRFSADQLPVRGAASTTAHSLPFGAAPARTPSPGYGSDCSGSGTGSGTGSLLRRRSDQDLLRRGAGSVELLAGAPTFGQSASASALSLPSLASHAPASQASASRPPSPGTSSTSSAAGAGAAPWPRPAPADPASTPPVPGRPLPGTPVMAPATTGESAVSARSAGSAGRPPLPATPGTPGTPGTPTSRPLPLPPAVAGPTGPSLGTAPAAAPAARGADDAPPPPYSGAGAAARDGQAAAEKTRDAAPAAPAAPGALTRAPSASRQACAYHPSARPGKQYAL